MKAIKSHEDTSAGTEKEFSGTILYGSIGRAAATSGHDMIRRTTPYGLGDWESVGPRPTACSQGETGHYKMAEWSPSRAGATGWVRSCASGEGPGEMAWGGPSHVETLATRLLQEGRLTNAEQMKVDKEIRNSWI